MFTNQFKLQITNCKLCNKEFSFYASKQDGKYCSINCRTQVWRNRAKFNNCLICNKKFRVYPSRLKKGVSKFCSRKCKGIASQGMPTYFSKVMYKGMLANPNNRGSLGHTPWNKGLKGFMSGEKNHFWKGGITPINKAIRNSIEYEEWRTKVFERDLYTCQNCDEIGGYLQADHIQPFALYPELRFEISNGRTLCLECHREIGAKVNQHITRQEYERKLTS